jgi:beta-galactosidase
MHLGVCYYPEHWPEAMWESDAQRMVALGLSRVRIGEFAWSRIEPEPGRYDWGWLDRAIAVLGEAGLGIWLGTPTATPPKWLVDQMPDMIALDADGRPRGFGSRRHYCFSHVGYARECTRIVEALAKRYGQHPAIIGWQTDNEFGCHDTVLSYSHAARDAFRVWLAARYGQVDTMNKAWGNVFWSMEYRLFDEVELPNLTVTEANPAHLLDFRRFSSDQVVAFNRAQVDTIKRHAAGRDVTHNVMGFFTDFDHHALGRDLDVVTWDSYPLGFLEQFWFSDAEKHAFLRQGHPDIAAFHHDLYRGCSPAGRWGVMEQQPGPVNWARYNPAPLPGMVRLWTLEAMAHGAELVSYFRWRQFPQAQEQMHAGLNRPDNVPAPAYAEVAQIVSDAATIGETGTPPKSVALVFDYAAAWVTDVQPQGRDFSALRLAFEVYTGLRRLGLDVDIVSSDTPLDGYRMVVVPTLPIIDHAFVDRLTCAHCPVLIGPRTGSKTGDFTIPADLPPGPLQQLIPIKVARVESLRPGASYAGEGFAIMRWIEEIESSLTPEIALANGQGIVWRQDNVRYLAGWPDERLLDRLIRSMAKEANLACDTLPEGVRTRRIGGKRFAFNYGADSAVLPWGEADYLVGGALLPAAGVAVWTEE